MKYGVRIGNEHSIYVYAAKDPIDAIVMHNKERLKHGNKILVGEISVFFIFEKEDD